MWKKLSYLTILAVAVFIFAIAWSQRKADADSGAVSVGPGIRYICQTSAPAPVGRARDWVLCSSGHRYYTDASNVDHDLQAAGSGYSTVQASGSSLTQRSTINFTGSGVSCVDNSGSSRTDCTISGSGSAVWDSTSPATIMRAQGTGISAGDFTVGTEFYVTTSATATGAQFYWGDGTAATIRVTLWSSGGAALKTVDVPVSGSGVYTGTFASTQALTTYTLYWISIRESTGTNFAAQYAITRPVVYALGPSVSLFSVAFAAGNAVPSTGVGGFYPVNPALTVP